jgi:N6-adenosine-specific RNA methylase IME4
VGKLPRGTCSGCKRVLPLSGGGRVRKHDWTDPTTNGRAVCPGSSDLSVENADLRARRRAEREQPLPDLPYRDSLECSICGHLAWKPEAHVTMILCPGSPNTVNPMTGETSGPEGSFTRAPGYDPREGLSGAAWTPARTLLMERLRHLAATYVAPTDTDTDIDTSAPVRPPEIEFIGPPPTDEALAILRERGKVITCDCGVEVELADDDGQPVRIDLQRSTRGTIVLSMRNDGAHVIRCTDEQLAQFRREHENRIADGYHPVGEPTLFFVEHVCREKYFAGPEPAGRIDRPVLTQESPMSDRHVDDVRHVASRYGYDEVIDDILARSEWATALTDAAANQASDEDLAHMLKGYEEALDRPHAPAEVVHRVDKATIDAMEKASSVECFQGKGVPIIRAPYKSPLTGDLWTNLGGSSQGNHWRQLTLYQLVTLEEWAPRPTREKDGPGYPGVIVQVGKGKNAARYVISDRTMQVEFGKRLQDMTLADRVRTMLTWGPHHRDHAIAGEIRRCRDRDALAQAFAAVLDDSVHEQLAAQIRRVDAWANDPSSDPATWSQDDPRLWDLYEEGKAAREGDGGPNAEHNPYGERTWAGHAWWSGRFGYQPDLPPRAAAPRVVKTFFLNTREKSFDEQAVDLHHALLGFEKRGLLPGASADCRDWVWAPVGAVWVPSNHDLWGTFSISFADQADGKALDGAYSERDRLYLRSTLASNPIDADEIIDATDGDVLAKLIHDNGLPAAVLERIAHRLKPEASVLEVRIRTLLPDVDAIRKLVEACTVAADISLVSDDGLPKDVVELLDHRYAELDDDKPDTRHLAVRLQSDPSTWEATIASCDSAEEVGEVYWREDCPRELLVLLERRMAELLPPPSPPATVVHVREPHPFADIFPMLSERELDDLAADIKAHGLREPIVLYQSKVLDGRNRQEACRRAGVEPRVEVFLGEDEAALELVRSKNLQRRQLTPAQRAFAAARLTQQADHLAWLRQEAARRAKAQGAQEPPRKASEQAAQVVGDVSPRSVENASKVLREGAPELVQAAEAGTVPLKTAAEIASLPLDEQRQVVAQLDPKVIAEASKKAKDEKKAKAREKEEKRQAEAAAKARERLPSLEGIDLRRCSVRELLMDITPPPKTPRAKKPTDDDDDAPDLDDEDLTVHGPVELFIADGPWHYDNKGNGAADNHYPTMDTLDIVEDFIAAYEAAAQNAYLITWCTGPMVFEFMDHVSCKGNGWPWEYCTMGVWGKPGRIGVGTHVRGDSEVYFIWTKGKPRPYDNAFSSRYDAIPRSEHSEKPVELLEAMVETFSPEGAVVGDLYAGRAPLARACLTKGRRYIGAELDQRRHNEALAALVPATPLLDAGASCEKSDKRQASDRDYGPAHA